jgi:hypothetical protein
MMYRSRWFAFEIPDEWWEAAGMLGFKTDRKAYRRSPPENADDATIIMLVDTIGVGPRGPGVSNFDRDRMVSVLTAIRRERALGPIQVTKANDQGYTHELYDGRHRLAASIAVGFPLVPAVIVSSLDEIKRSEGMRAT